MTKILAGHQAPLFTLPDLGGAAHSSQRGAAQGSSGSRVFQNQLPGVPIHVSVSGEALSDLQRNCSHILGHLTGRRG